MTKRYLVSTGIVSHGATTSGSSAPPRRRAQYRLRQSFVVLEARVFNKPEVFVDQANQKIDASDALTGPPTRDIIAKQIAGFAAFARAHERAAAMT